MDITQSKYPWLIDDSGRPLHYVPELKDLEMWAEDIHDAVHERTWITACGADKKLFLPGIFTRMYCERCPECCTAIGITDGIGCPINDKTCKERNLDDTIRYNDESI